MEGCPRDFPEIRPDATLVAAGWTQRFLAEPARVAEMTENYGRLGYEVRTQAPHPEDFAPSCGDCPATACRTYVMIYTRRK